MDGSFSIEKQPHNLEVEQALLGAVLINSKDVLPLVRQIVSRDDFFEPVHGDIFEASCDLDDKGKEAKPVTLKHHFEHHPGLQDVEGARYLVKLAGSATTTINARDYAGTVKELSDRRTLSLMMDCYSDEINNTSLPLKDIVDRIESEIHELTGYGGSGEKVRATDAVVKSALERYQQAKDQDGLVGLSTGFRDLDKLFSLSKSELTILAGRPAMGKSALANSISFSAAQECGGLFFSKEMDAEDNAFRAISADISRRHGKTVPYFRIKRGALNLQEQEWLYESAKNVAQAQIVWSDIARLTPSKIRSVALRTRRQFEKKGTELGFIVVDYLQQVKPDNRSLRGLYEQTTAVSGALLELAKELEIPVLALSQLSRAVEQRDDKTPTLADLRDSGSLEQDAANIIFAYRPEYYHKNDQTIDDAERARWQHKTQLILAKNRNGPCETVVVHSNMAANHFEDL